MKKTFITLATLALASVASAADYTLTVPTGGNFWAGDYEFDFIVGQSVADMIDTGSSMVIASYWGGAKDLYDNIPASYHANAYVLTKGEDGALTLTVGRGAYASTNDLGSTWAPDLTSTWTFASGNTDKSTFTTTIEVGTRYTISSNGDSQDEDKDGDGYMGQVVTLSTVDGVLETASWYKGNMNGGGAETAMQAYFNPLVPEPTTATLSLLALAGLAARRRRK